MKRTILLILAICLFASFAQAQQKQAEPQKQETKEQQKPEPAVAVTDKDHVAWMTSADREVVNKEFELQMLKLGRSTGEAMILREMGLNPQVWMLRKTATGYEAVKRPQPAAEPGRTDK